MNIHAPARAKHSILIVDDMTVSRQILVMLLENAGYLDVRTATDAHRAVDELSRRLPDLIIADLHMPGISGAEFLRYIRGNELTWQIPFILTSGDDTNKAIDLAWSLGLNKFLPKPFNAEQLVSAIAQACARRRVS